ncbi:leucine-rich repeat and IQ domain-containing protein 1 [Tripterygium wilfordii]|uniref:Leucine-rich repeat and IQ domain-containing protein 1 n=1 Tax=Tripterygium wilfordii TaxID=458696 RepID=A0A7J7DET6_TRIWF|nr:leucine-rich repeat-containing protein 9 [Tripterygium wilfordii]KAF5744895.1 leucine-rich repeat and IQ domain-containing protein 1 [Tripterygium wilfordii]
MTCLTIEQVLKEKQTGDRNAVTVLDLNWKALSDVSCLSEFKNLEKLDLGSNNLTSLEGLRSCVNLKWLSVVQNNLQSLKGIEGLSKLTVLNAGKNKLKSMEEVKSLVSLRAVILNDNEIASICKLDQMKDLNTLVLSKNPIRKIGGSLANVKSIRKVSLSHCQLEAIESSLKSCTELKELRLAHNDIKVVPPELASNRKLQNLDLGNNLITRWSDLKVLNSLVNLKNLNLQGNPIAEKDELAKKVQNSLPNLHVFNAKPINKFINDRKDVNVGRVDSSSLIAGNEIDNASILNVDEQLKQKKKKAEEKTFKKEGLVHKETTDHDTEEVLKRKRKKSNDEISANEEVNFENSGVDVEMKPKKKMKKENLSKKEVRVIEQNNGEVKNKLRKKLKKVQGELDIIDDGEASFADLFAANSTENTKYGGVEKKVDKVVHNLKDADGLAAYPAKKKKSKSKGIEPKLDFTPTVEIGMGGLSTWDD